MKTHVIIFTMLSFIILTGCTKEENTEDSNSEEQNDDAELRGCTDWAYNGNFRSNEFDASIQNYLPAVRSRICEISNTDTTITVNAVIEPANGGIRLFGDDYNGIEISFYGGEKIVLSKNHFNDGGTIERTITANIADLNTYDIDSWSIALSYDFVYAVPTMETSNTTVQELIDMGVSLNDIRDVHGYSSQDIYGNLYLDGIITDLRHTTNFAEIIEVTVMAPEDYPQEMNWDTANAMFPDSFYPSSNGQWSIPQASDYDWSIAHITASTNPHPSWVRPDGGYWLPGQSNDEWNAYGDVYIYSGDGIRTEALKEMLLKVRLIKKFDL